MPSGFRLAAVVAGWIAGAVVAGAAWADQRVWSGLGDGASWSDPGNWVGGVVPGAGDDAVIGPGGGGVVVTTLNTPVKSLQCQRPLAIVAGARLSVQDPLTLQGLTIGLGGRLTVAGELTLLGNSLLDGGSLYGPGRKTIAPGATLSVINANADVEGALDNFGLVLLSAGLNMVTCTLTNQPGGVLRVDGPSGAARVFGNNVPPSTLNNLGQIEKLGGCDWIVQVPVASNGPMAINAGTVSTVAGLALAVPVSIAGGAELTVQGPLAGAGGVGVFVGSGRLILAGAVGTLNGPVNFGGRLSVQYAYTDVRFAQGGAFGQIDPIQGRLTFDGPLQFAGPLTVGTGGRLVLNAAQSITDIALADGATLDGAGAVTVTQSMACASATLTGPGPLTIGPAAALSFAGTAIIDKPLINLGTMVMGGSLVLGAPLSLGGSVVFDVPQDLTWQVLRAGGTPGQFTTTGVVRKRGPGKLVLAANFHNLGTLEVEAGACEVQECQNIAGPSLRGGGWNVRGDGVLTFPYALHPGSPIIELVPDPGTGTPAWIRLDGPGAQFDPANQRWRIAFIDAGCGLAVSNGASVYNFPNEPSVGGGFLGVPMLCRGTLSSDSRSKITLVNGLVLDFGGVCEVSVVDQRDPGLGAVFGCPIVNYSGSSQVRLAGLLRVRYGAGYVGRRDSPPLSVLAHGFDEQDCFALTDLPPGAWTRCEVGRVWFAPSCPSDYNGDAFHNLDDLGDFITDYYTLPAIPGGAQPAAPTYAGVDVGFGVPCVSAPDAPPPYSPGAYRASSYRVGYSPDGSNSCPLAPGQPFPNLDNLNDFITGYYTDTGLAC